ncbi:MAG: type III secretion system inner membrane ring subunit SctD [Candidatus Competibacteraceae bacterium]|nr:type III secretion system inner membrane ring subunit SctD [Candidatus Competibacteraceae bacterium]
MSDSRQRFILKFFSGPHAGAEIRLPLGDYLLGGAEACDIVVHDAAVAPRHARLRLNATDIQLSPLERAITVAGQSSESEISMAFGQIATLGTTHFAVAPEGASWETVALPDLVQAGATPEETPVAEPALQPALAADTRAPDPGPRRHSGLRARRFASLGGVAAIAGALVIVLLYGNSPPTGASLPEPRIQTAENQLRALIAELNIDQAQLTRSDQGDWRLSGYVADATQKRHLTAALQQRGLRAQLQVWSPDELLESGRAVLNGLNLPLTVSYAGPGILALNGQVQDPLSLTRAAEMLRRDIHGLRQLDNRATVAAGRAATSARAADDRFATRLPAAETARRPPSLHIKSVNLSSVRFVVTIDGAKYLEGASLGNGFALKTIRDDGLILSDGDRDIIQDFGRSE